MTVTVLKKRRTTLGRVVAVDLPTKRGTFNIHFNRGKKGRSVRMTTDAGVKYYFSLEDAAEAGRQLIALAG